MNNSPASTEKDTLHLISHTHWDREWYFSFQHFRYRLVHMINELLDYLPSHPEFKYFHLDGQSIVVEDYLEVEPERKGELVSHIQEGRILVGPWYVLADEFLVSGESLIRNLLMGDYQCRQLGNKMNLGYLPDLFGHIGQMPQILKGFGMTEAVLWRGISDRGGDRLPSEWIWKGTDGTEILALHLPDAYGYSNGSSLPYGTEPLKQEIRRLYGELKPYAGTPHLLIMNGTDHQMAHLPIPGTFAELNHDAGPYEIIHSTLPDYAEAVKNRLTDRSTLQVHEGELRATNHGYIGAYNFVLPNVLSSRMYLKQWNERVQTTLEKHAEPLAVMASLHSGSPYPQTLLRTAWKYLMQNHPHDSICGCSIDDVHRHMVVRFEWAHEIASQVIKESLYALTKRMRAEEPAPNESLLHVFNPLPFSVTEALDAEIHFTGQDPIRGIELYDDQGNEIPVKLQHVSSHWVTPDFMEKWPPSNAYYAQIARISLSAEEVPAFGFRTYKVKSRTKPYRKWVAFSEYHAVPVMENDHLKVAIHENGSFDLCDKATGRTYPGLHIFEDGADIGDGYTFSETRSDRIFTTYGEKASVRLVEKNAIRTVYEISIDWELPGGIMPDNQQRSPDRVACRIVSGLELAAAGKRLDIETSFDNAAKDHRLRVLFPTGIQTDEAYAEGSFAVDRRSIHVAQPAADVWLEDEPTTFPHKGFVDLCADGAGLALIARGLPEFEVSRTPERAIALTLLRSVGYLGAGKRALSIASGAGPEMETPESQCIGMHRYRYSLYPHAGDWAEGGVQEQAQRHSAGLIGVQNMHPQTEERYDRPASFLHWENRQVLLSAVKKCEHRDSTILRMYNPTGNMQSARVAIGVPVREAYFTDLKEERQQPLEAAGGRSDAAELLLHFEPGQILTVELVG